MHKEFIPIDSWFDLCITVPSKVGNWILLHMLCQFYQVKKTNDVRLLFSGIEWTKFASREKWFLSHRHMHWSDCLWVAYSMYLYIFFPSCCQLLLYHIHHQRIKGESHFQGLLEMSWSLLTKSSNCFSHKNPGGRVKLYAWKIWYYLNFFLQKLACWSSGIIFEWGLISEWFFFFFNLNGVIKLSFRISDKKRKLPSSRTSK